MNIKTKNTGSNTDQNIFYVADQYQEKTHSKAEGQKKIKTSRAADLCEKPLDTRTRILLAALSAFATRGFRGVSTTEIAKAAFVTQPLIHYHFKSKLHLWQAVIEYLWEQFEVSYSIDTYAEVDNNYSDQDKWKVGLKRWIDFCSDWSEFGQLILQEGTCDSERLQWLIEHLLRPFLQKVMGQEVQLSKAMAPILLVLASSQLFALSPLISKLFGTVATTEQKAEWVDWIEQFMDNLSVTRKVPEVKGEYIE